MLNNDCIKRSDIYTAIKEWTVDNHDSRLLEQVINDIPAAADVEPKYRWIDADDALPDEGISVLICYYDYRKSEDGKRNIAISRRFDFNYWSELGREIVVTHWMPLPLLPEQSKTEEE